MSRGAFCYPCKTEPARQGRNPMWVPSNPFFLAFIALAIVGVVVNHCTL
jgi:hypothetical protein